MLEIESRELNAALRELVQSSELAEPHACGHIREIELSANDVDLHAVEPRAHDALQTVLFRELGFRFIVQNQRAAFDRRHIFVRMKTERDEIPKRADALAV